MSKEMKMNIVQILECGSCKEKHLDYFNDRFGILIEKTKRKGKKEYLIHLFVEDDESYYHKLCFHSEHLAGLAELLTFVSGIL